MGHLSRNRPVKSGSNNSSLNNVEIKKKVNESSTQQCSYTKSFLNHFSSKYFLKKPESEEIRYLRLSVNLRSRARGLQL